MKKKDLVYEGKAKKIWSTEDAQSVVIEFKDSLTAFNAQKKGSFASKGSLNLSITSFIFDYLQSYGIKTHSKAILNENEWLTEKLTIIPVEVVVRNRRAGSLAKKFGMQEGEVLKNPLVEFYFKNDELQDPFMNDDQVLDMNLMDRYELEWVKVQALKINARLIELFTKLQLSLVDFKIEFGRGMTGEIILADEITPDSCRLWDMRTDEKLDKDRFRRDLGGVEEAYREVSKRLFDYKASLEKAHKFVVEIKPRDVILDTQGRAVLETLQRQENYSQLQNCRIGRFVEMSFTGDPKESFLKVKNAADSLLHNPLIESYEIRKL